MKFTQNLDSTDEFLAEEPASRLRVLNDQTLAITLDGYKSSIAIELAN